METFIERLAKEINDLFDKIEKLGAFLASDKYNELDYTQQALLRIQFDAMNTYYKCIYTRYELLTGEDKQ